MIKNSSAISNSNDHNNTSQRENQSGQQRRSKNQSQKPRTEEKRDDRSSKQSTRRSNRKSESKNLNNNATLIDQQQQQQILLNNPSTLQSSNRKNSQSTQPSITTSSSVQSSPGSYPTQFPSINEITSQMTAHKSSSLSSNPNNSSHNTTGVLLSSPNDNSFFAHLQDSPSEEQQRSVSPIKEERKYDLEDQENNSSLANYLPTQMQSPNSNSTSNAQSSQSCSNGSSTSTNNTNNNGGSIGMALNNNNNQGVIGFSNNSANNSSMHLSNSGISHSTFTHQNNSNRSCSSSSHGRHNTTKNTQNQNILSNNNGNTCSSGNLSNSASQGNNEKSLSKQKCTLKQTKKFEYKHGQINLNNPPSSSSLPNNKNPNYPMQTATSQSLCQNNKGLRNLSNLLKSLKFSPLLAQKQQVTQNLMTLPFELHFMICSYLSPKDIYLHLAFVNQHFYKMSKDTRLWNFVSRFQELSINDKYQKNIPVVERRSKGRLFSAVSRLDKKQVNLIALNKFHLNTFNKNVNIMISNAGQDDGVPTSILRELSYLQTLDHPNITKVHEVDIKNVQVQIVSERQEYNLKEFIKQYIKQNPDDKGVSRPQYKIPLDQLKNIAYQILEGLNYLHHEGIMHRNLKIDNILLDKDEKIKISDFGLSRLVSIPHIPYTPEDPKERERSGREARRLWYRAPELLLRKSIYTFEIDMWSFGCLLAEIVLNEPLFAGDSEIEQLFKVFKFIGSPDQETLMSMCDNPDYQQTFPKWKTINLSHICEPNQSEEFKQLKTTMIPNRQNGFQKLKYLGTALGLDGMKLLNSLLQLNPYKRITAQEALYHPFFDDVRQQRHLETIPQQILSHISQEANKVSASPNKCCNQVVPSCYFQFSLPYCFLSKIYQTMTKQEQNEALLKREYMKDQVVITENMRIILIDWLIDVSVHFEAQDETLHYCISYIDRVLSIMNIERQKLQLVGVSCMKIADIFNERSREYYKQENAMEYAYITAEEYNAAQLIAMEKKILKKLGFQLNTPNMMYFLKIICTLFDTDSQVSVIAMFLSDLLLMSYDALKFRPSLLASCCVFLSFLTNERDLPSEEKLNEARPLLDHHTLDEFKEAVEFVRKFWHYYRSDPTTLNFESVYNKYAIVYGLEARLINTPLIVKTQLDKWIYTKK